MIPFTRMSPAFALAALTISILTAGALAIERLSDWALIQGSGGEPTSPAPPFGPDIAARILFPRHGEPDSPHANEMISLAYNWGWNAETGWARSDLDKPSVALTLESWYDGLAELNFDMRPPRGFTGWPGGRALGLAARHDGTYATLSVGGPRRRQRSATVNGVGPQNAAALLTAAGDNLDRLRTGASFAALCGTSPIDASSGRQQRHRLNRG